MAGRKKGAWFEVKKGGSLLRIAETAGCLLNFLSRKCLTADLCHPSWMNEVLIKREVSLVEVLGCKLLGFLTMHRHVKNGKIQKINRARCASR